MRYVCWLGSVAAVACLVAGAIGAIPLRVPVPVLPPEIAPLPAPLLLPEIVEAPALLPVVNDGFADDQDVSGSLAPLIAAVRSPTFGEREAGTRALLRLPPRRLDEIVRALAVESDSEAIARLTQAAGHLYLKSRTSLRMQDSFLGAWFKRPNPLATTCMLGTKFKLELIKLRPADAEPTMTVVLTELQPGFPAAQTLINGDRIVTFDGKGLPGDWPVDDRVQFQKIVLGLWPRQFVPVTILRDGKFLEVQVQLAGMPGNDTLALVEQVDLRAAELARFLAGLKTGEKAQAVLP